MADRSVGLLPEDHARNVFGPRAAGYDRENRFFQEDFDELTAAGYLKMAVPKELGGLGFSLADVAQRDPPAGDVRAGHRARHEHAPLLGRARRRPLARRRQVAASGSSRKRPPARSSPPVTPRAATKCPVLLVDHQGRAGGRRLQVHRPEVVRQPHAGLDAPRPARDGHQRSRRRRRSSTASCRATPPGITIKETWDVLGMRATRSDDTVLEGAFCPGQVHRSRRARRVRRRSTSSCSASSRGRWSNFGNVYYGLACACCELIVEQVKSKASLALTPIDGVSPRSPARRRRHRDGARSDRRAARDPSPATGRGRRARRDWPIKIVAAKYRAVEGAWRVVDRALDVSGGFGMFKKSELERLFRDARAGRFHPANSALSHELVGKLALGINPDEQPRWG